MFTGIVHLKLLQPKSISPAKPENWNAFLLSLPYFGNIENVHIQKEKKNISSFFYKQAIKHTDAFQY